MAVSTFNISTRLNVKQILDCCSPNTSLDLTIDSIKVYDGNTTTGSVIATVGPFSWIPGSLNANYDVTINNISCSGLAPGDLITVEWTITINTITNTGSCTQTTSFSNGQTITREQTTTAPAGC